MITTTLSPSLRTEGEMRSPHERSDMRVVASPPHVAFAHAGYALGLEAHQ
ncbi:hypothetical protein BJ123_1346 [Rhodopseudomonas thermotolerans]|uniref:Uncharacterized protein n=2 Tax=Rhodopseudomonas TaxID=1073 RepID=A0A336JX42_9BRAD|nr:hypothetical protein BJ125_1346 [Rhodopseudomonas pentothenatexigens]REF90240.1 hypothetical protein BJ123_1346 [Rhodopseudomonas thermotolerans]SSW93273.1 hypothetical protein SAMN05892882_1346 [Rhodopseudomonas pentothenatexigens]